MWKSRIVVIFTKNGHRQNPTIRKTILQILDMRSISIEKTRSGNLVMWEHWIFENLKPMKPINFETEKPRNQETTKTNKPRNQEAKKPFVHSYNSFLKLKQTHKTCLCALGNALFELGQRQRAISTMICPNIFWHWSVN